MTTSRITTTTTTTTKATTSAGPDEDGHLLGQRIDDAPIDATARQRDMHVATTAWSPAAYGRATEPSDAGASYKRPRQCLERDDEQERPRTQDESAKRPRTECALSVNPTGDSRGPPLALDAMPAEMLRLVLDLVGDRDLGACLLASACFHVYTRAEMLARRYALGSGRDIFDSDEPVGDIVALCKRQRRRVTLAMLERPAARGRRDIVAVVMQAFKPSLRGFAWRASPLDVPGNARALNRALVAAVEAGHAGTTFEIAARLGFADTLIATRLMLRAARAGHLSLVQHLHRGMAHCAAEACKRKGASPMSPHAACAQTGWDSNVGLTAWDNGRVDILDWLLESRCPHAIVPSSYLLNDAVRRGRVPLARWVASHSSNNREMSCARAAVDTAASAGHADAVRWAHESGLRRCAVSTIEAATVSDRPRCLDILKWAAGERERAGAVPEWRDARVALKAAEHGRLEVIRWLAEAHRECLTPEAARCAARHGHADVVLFLHKAGVAPMARYNPLKRTAKSLNAQALAIVAGSGAPYDARALAVAIRHKSMPMVAVLCGPYAASIDTVEAMRMAGADAACKIARHMAAVLPGACLSHARAAVPPHRSAKALGQCPCAACRAAAASAKEAHQPRRAAQQPEVDQRHAVQGAVALP